jgi:hypothetical protein
MSYTFRQALQAFKNNQFRELAADPDGLRFLKLRSLSRREEMERLVQASGVSIQTNHSTELLQALFESPITNDQIERTIRAIYAEGRTERCQCEDELVSELYQMQVFDWGGLHQNSLERTIVDNYVKKIRSYTELSEKIEQELHHSLRAYTLCSWYNHWTSIIIEDIFRDHPRVLPAVGLIKKIDFFIENVPFDLKVTYLPEGYIKAKRQAEGLRPEMTLLRGLCRSLGIHFDRTLPESRLLEDLWIKVNDHPADNAKTLLKELQDKRLWILETCRAHPEELIRWLYENQGVRRFDAANRLFLVLVDCGNFFASWMLKRAKPLLIDAIHRHLDNIGERPGFDISFEWEGDTYTTTSDVIFVVHNR